MGPLRPASTDEFECAASAAGRSAAGEPAPLPPPFPPPFPTEELDAILRRALEEDLGPGDLTSDVLAPAGRARGTLRCKAAGFLCGLDAFARVFELLDAGVRTRRLAADARPIAPGDALASVEGSARALLVGERTALNLVQRLSGVATLTARFVERAAGRARILDTRKTTPGLRVLERYAVRCGGGENHRFGLFDQAMIKDNHVELSGEGVGALVARLRERHPPDVLITAEARDEGEALEAVAAGADVVLLDNLPAPVLEELCPRLRTAAREAGRPVELEASGGVDLDTIARIAASGVDRVSIGALTHSAPALDLSFELERLP